MYRILSSCLFSLLFSLALVCSADLAVLSSSAQARRFCSDFTNVGL